MNAISAALVCAAFPALNTLFAPAAHAVPAAIPAMEGPPIEEITAVRKDPRSEMLELFGKVEKRLGEIDRLLFQAGAGETKLETQEESGISELLNQSVHRSEDVLKCIDRMLEIAAQQGGSCSSGQPSEQSQTSGSPLDQQTPSGPREREQGREQSPSPQESQPSSEPKGQQEPRSPGEDPNTDPRNRSGSPPPSGETATPEDSSGAERWGDLPEQVRQLFRTEGGGDMPPQYRDWIESYYRRLNKRR
jgi:hypothetical protein